MIHNAKQHSGCTARKAAEWIAALCAVFMLCILPVLFRDAFFDINRFKVAAVLIAVPCFVFLRMMAAVLQPVRRSKAYFGSVLAPVICLVFFLASCVIACARAGFPVSTLTGEDGRYCGLLFMLACGAAFFVIASGTSVSEKVPLLAILTGAGVAALGVLNALGVDPLGFYTHIKKGQEQVFLSTIGHFDFFGTYLIMIFGLAAGYSVFSGSRCVRWFARLAAVVMAFGMSAARTDSAFLGLHLVCFSVTAISGAGFAYLARALVLWALGMLTLPVMSALFPLSPYGVSFSGLPGALCSSGIALVISAFLFVLGVVFALLQRAGKRAPGRERVQRLFLAVFAAAVLIVFAVMVFFTVFAQDVALPGAASILRFDDEWGSLRGFVYTRSLRAYADYSLAEKLFGRGMETTLSILTPYFDRPEMLVYGVFNDPHCQPLQMLLTCGAAGMLTFVAFYILMLFTVFRFAGEDPLLCGVFSSLMGYLVVLAINVTQPILISTYFSIAALAVCRIRNKKRGEDLRES